VQASDDNFLDDFLTEQSSLDMFPDCLSLMFWLQVVQASDDNFRDDFLAQQSSLDTFSACLTLHIFQKMHRSLFDTFPVTDFQNARLS
jgi:hypothetical protein